MKNDLKKDMIAFMKQEIGDYSMVNKAIKKYFKGKETEWNNKVMYIGDTITLSQENGELYVTGHFGELVWNCETLFTDLPHIVHLVLKARNETDQRIKQDIIGIIKNDKE